MASSICGMHAATVGAEGLSSRKLCNAAHASSLSLQSRVVLPSKFVLCGSNLLKLLSRRHISTLERKGAVQPSASANGTGAFAGLSINLRGKRAFIAGVADDQGYGWALARQELRSLLELGFLLSTSLRQVSEWGSSMSLVYFRTDPLCRLLKFIHLMLFLIP